ncbi:hypothetical protein PU629_20335 [Pullulanibacillus sp. KACC 23026]|uniref:hypothetical protein n=1 Tax=Pullulanibacillus sp. KACC 23026 TaxID=3028315 RepID=UPI0023B12237|nr:hypothetical protein [Pullulanibacillus sp. KACC 23026]WEG12418.1 hypothetical protein PU629_20335 [Pullulanibacillus sp. KACC 23026]
MEGRIFNSAILHSKQVEAAHSVSKSQNDVNVEYNENHINSGEFLRLTGGAAFIAIMIYLLSFVIL